MVETLDNKKREIDEETSKIKRKIKWAFICFFGAWILMIAILVLGSIKSSTAIQSFIQHFGAWITLLSFALFIISIILMIMILKYLRKRKKEARTQSQK
ncbi:MAG: hypothetical protein NTX24_01505 [Candidatus Pacearchaeota archaeon]|nr:hypothetical protein [Candidatus Pacearchaeota archaeon]